MRALDGAKMSKNGAKTSKNERELCPILNKIEHLEHPKDVELPTCLMSCVLYKSSRAMLLNSMVALFKRLQSRPPH
jgi:hypothetical protein